MGEKDITEKILEDYNEVFADIVNGLIFKGEQKVKPDQLKNKSIHSQYKADTDNKIHELERDVVKDWSPSNVSIAICGIENQTKPEKNMPARIFGYEGASYRSQILEDENANLTPVVTIILYFGTEKRWDSSKSLKELIKIPKGMETYVNNIKINVFEVAWLTDDEISRFNSDFKIVANFFSKKRKNKDYIPDDTTEIKHTDELLKLLKVMSGDSRYEEVLVSNKIKEVRNMCDVAERLDKRGYERGLSEGISEGIEQGKIIAFDLIVNAAKEYKGGLSYEEMKEKYGDQVADKVISLY